MHARVPLLAGLLVSLVAAGAAAAEPSASALKEGVRGVATRAPEGMTIDGDLSEFADAFCTPVEYFHNDLRNRAAQFFYMWDDEAFYAGLRTLDTRQANPAPDDRLWGGDAVEWYFDTRRGPDFRGTDWGPGAVHCYWTGYKDTALQGRFCLRPEYLDAIPQIGIEVGVRQTADGAEVEFKLPWANFPDFKPAAGEVIALDAELCYSDGGPRTYRTFAYGSPLSVQQPASQARVQLVERFLPEHWKACGPVLAPIRVDVAWTQPTKAHAHGLIALPPNFADQVGSITFELTDLEGEPLGSFAAEREVFAAEGHFERARAEWPIDVAPPGAHHVTAVLHDRQGQPLARVAPRLTSVNMQPGY